MAFSGGAAAVPADPAPSAEDVDVADGVQTQEISFTAENETGDGDYNTGSPANGTITISPVEDLTFDDVSVDNVDGVTAEVDGNGDIVVTVDAVNTVTASEVDITVNAEVDPSGTTAASGTYNLVSDSGNNQTVVFDITSSGSGDANLGSGATFWEGQNLDLFIPSNVDDTTDYQVRELDTTANDGDGSIEGLVEEVSIDSDDRTLSYDSEGLNGDYVITPADDSSTAIVFENGIATSTVTDSGDDTNNAGFEVTEQSLSVAFDDENVDDSETTYLDLDTNRGTTDVVVHANGDLDDEDFETIFNDTDADYTLDLTLDSGEVDDLDDDYDLDQEDAVVLRDVSDLDTDDENGPADFSDIDMGEYDFQFDVSDTAASDSASISVTEEDVDAEFTEDVTTSAAGDLVEFTVEMEDASETFIQIGDEDVGFVDVLHVEDDDDDGEVTFTVNTRTLGTAVDTERVYDSEDDIINSEVHGDDTGAEFYDDDEDNLLNASNNPDTSSDFEVYLDQLDLIDVADETAQEQLTRPLQPAEYDIITADFADEGEGEFGVNSDDEAEANEELSAALLELEAPTIGDLTTHVASAADADEDDNVEDLLGSVTPREEIAEDDRLVIQVEATGFEGALVDSTGDFDSLEDGMTLAEFNGIINDSEDADWASEGINFNVEADDATGNQDATELDLENDDESQAFVVFDEDNGQFFVVVDTSAGDDVFSGSIDDGDTFTAEMEYETDEDDRYAFADGPVEPYNGEADNDEGGPAYPYFQADSTVTSEATFDIVAPEVNFDNVNVDGNLEAENIEDAEISGTTNVAPGTDGEIQVSSTDASTSFRNGQSVNISEDGEISAEFDFSDQEVDDEFDTSFRVGGSDIDSVSSILVEEGTLEDDAPEEDDESEDDMSDDGESDDSASDDGESDDSASDDSASDDSASDDGESDDSSSEETPGFGAIVALVAVLGAALLATRRQN